MESRGQLQRASKRSGRDSERVAPTVEVYQGFKVRLNTVAKPKERVFWRLTVVQGWNNLQLTRGIDHEGMATSNCLSETYGIFLRGCHSVLFCTGFPSEISGWAMMLNTPSSPGGAQRYFCVAKWRSLQA